MKHRDPVTPAVYAAVMGRDQKRFWAKVWKPSDFPCWFWVGGLTYGGRYGGFKLDGKMRPAHRVAWEWANGPIPEGMELDHLCRMTACVRPDHLEPVTHAENMRRGYGWAGINARKLVCSRGHDQPLEQTASGRVCRQCLAENNHNYRLRQGSAPSISEGTKRSWAKLTPVERAARGRKGWETRRRNATP